MFSRIQFSNCNREATSPNSLITIEVFDKDYLSADDFIAQTSVSLTSLKQTGTVNSWFNLQPQGSIHLEIKLNFAYSKVHFHLSNQLILIVLS